MNKKLVHAALFGLAVGDALGVPVEFKSRESLKMNPVKGMQEFGTHNQPKGTWSDDSSLTFCLAESLLQGYDLNDIANKFVDWRKIGYWAARGEVFDIGIATRQSINNIERGFEPTLCGGFDEESNGNGSLMRILPMAFHLYDIDDLNLLFQKNSEVSSITHAHFRSRFCCFIYTVFAIEIINGASKNEAYSLTKEKVNNFISDKDFNSNELKLLDRILKNNIAELNENEINSSGYVLHSLEASIWCILNSNSYEETVLKAVNLGGDTDTTAAIAGGLAGLIYGYDAIPKEWIYVLARKNDIEKLCDKLSEKYEIH